MTNTQNDFLKKFLHNNDWKDISEKEALAEIAKFVFSGNNIDIENKDGETLLGNAAKNDFITVIDFLIEHGADVNHRDLFGATPLLKALLNGKAKASAILVGNGASINVCTRRGASTLMYAAANGMTGVMNYLLKKGVHINARTQAGQTALTYAVYNGQEDAVKLLLQHGANKELGALGSNALATATRSTHFTDEEKRQRIIKLINDSEKIRNDYLVEQKQSDISDVVKRRLAVIIDKQIQFAIKQQKLAKEYAVLKKLSIELEQEDNSKIKVIEKNIPNIIEVFTNNRTHE